jgi:hypothetical protein
MKTPLRFAAVASLSCALLVAARAADIDGKWKADFDTMIGVQKYVFELKADGEKLTGRALGERETDKSDTAITEGKITKDEVFFVEPLKFQNMDLRIEYRGKLAGDELQLARKVGDFEPEKAVAKRVKPAAGITGKWTAEFDSQIGPIKYVYEFKADGEKLTGKASVDRAGQMSEPAISEGKFVNGEVTFAEPWNVEGQEVRIDYNGKLVGDELKLHRKVGNLAEYDLVAKRVKEDAAKK